MPKVEGTYPHNMNTEDAINASKKAIDKLLSVFEATDKVTFGSEDSVGFSCKSRGFSIVGQIKVCDKEVLATVDLPMVALAFKGLVQAAIDKHIPKHLERTEDD